jgi:hypothetical protein
MANTAVILMRSRLKEVTQLPSKGGTIVSPTARSPGGPSSGASGLIPRGDAFLYAGLYMHGLVGRMPYCGLLHGGGGGGSRVYPTYQYSRTAMSISRPNLPR